jgi:anti-sigma factor RsiW
MRTLRIPALFFAHDGADGCARHGIALEEGTTEPRIDITEDDLHAYIDGTLDRPRRLAVALYLIAHPAEAARVEVFRAQKEAVNILFGSIIDEPLPQRLKQALRLSSGSPLRRR